MRNYTQICQKNGKKKRFAGLVCVFFQNLVYTSENHSNFKDVLLNIWGILELNVSFTELSETKETLSNRNFSGSDKFNELENLLFV